MARVTDPSFKFRFDESAYTVQGAESMYRAGTPAEARALRAEYTRMRDVAQKRIKRLEKQFPGSKTYLEHRLGFKKLKDLDPRDLPKAFSELAKFVKAKASTVTGQKQIKEKTIATWQKQGLNLTSENYDTAIKILEEMRRRKIVYGSDKVISMAEHMQGLSQEEQSKWLAHLDFLFAHEQQLQEIPSAAGYSFEQVISMLGG